MDKVIKGKSRKYVWIQAAVQVLIIILLILGFYPAIWKAKSKTTSLDTIEYDDDTYHYVSYVNSKGEITLDSVREYATVRKLLDDNGNTIEEYYLDCDGNMVERPGEYFGVKRIFTYDTHSGGYLCLQYCYVDRGGTPVDITSGYAAVNQTFNVEGKVVKQTYLDSNYEPVASIEDVYGSVREYDEEGKLIWLTYVDSSGEPCVTNRKYASIFYEYREDGKTDYIWYYDINREPVNIGRGQYGYHYTYAEDGTVDYIPVGKNGKEVISMERILSDNPILIIFAVIICAELAVRLRFRCRVGLLCGYIVVILYMTLLNRSFGDGSESIELFTSYRHIFTDAFARKEIYENILLFVPFGVLMRSIIPRQHRKFRIKSHNTNSCILHAFLFSLFIECTQLIFAMGTFQLDDLVNNTLGGALGAVGYCVIKKYRNKYHHSYYSSHRSSHRHSTKHRHAIR